MEIDLDGRWGIGGKLHGGYLLRELVRPLLTDDHPHPLAVSAHFLRAPEAGTAEVVTETLRTGRRVGQHRSTLVQGETCVETLVTTGRLDPAAEPFWTSSAPPPIRALEDSPRTPAEPFPGFRVGQLEFVDLRPGTELVGSVEGSSATLLARVRMDGTDGVAGVEDLLVLADAMPPVTLDMGLPGWVPTVELTVLVRAVPAPGWLVARQRARLMEDGWLDEECDIWDSRGRLVCQARQLASYRL